MEAEPKAINQVRSVLITAVREKSKVLNSSSKINNAIDIFLRNLVIINLLYFYLLFFFHGIKVKAD